MDQTNPPPTLEERLLPLLLGNSISVAAVIDMVRQHDVLAYGSYFQTCTRGWAYACFPSEVVENLEERTDRFVEEALELAQATEGYGAERAHALVDYVFGRPVGYAPQEVGGVMVTLTVLCSVLGINVDDAAWDELNRIRDPEVMDKIRRKQAAKPTGSALPQ